MNKVRMHYRHRREWKWKLVTISEIAEWIKHGKYRARVEAARGLKEIAMKGGMASGPIVTEELPLIMPAKGEREMYTGLVLLSFHVDEGVAKLEQLRQRVNLWPPDATVVRGCHRAVAGGAHSV